MLCLVFQSQPGNSLSCLKSSFIPHAFLQIIMSNYSYLNKIYTFDNELTTSNRWFLHLENTLVKRLLPSPPFPLTHCQQCWLSFTYLIILCLNSFLIFRVKYIYLTNCFLSVVSNSKNKRQCRFWYDYTDIMK